MAIQFNKFMRSVMIYASYTGLGGLGALQALKLEMFSFPPNGQLYLSYFFSIVTFVCIFLSGGLGAINLTSRITDIHKKIKEIDSKDLPDKL
jgi:hypothetical protein